MKPSIVGNSHYGDDPRETLFLVPTCKRCGHDICPCCGTWCDTLIYSKEPDDVSPCPCIDEDGECDLGGEEVIEVGPVYGMDRPPGTHIYESVP